jgi:hypothetical protein
MPGISFQIDDREFQSNLRQYALVMKITFAEAIKRQARLVAVNLAYQTQPFGDSYEARQSGEGAVQVEISRVYNPVSAVAYSIGQSGKTFTGIKRIKTAPQAAAAFVRLIKSGQNEKAQEILNALRIEPYFTTKVGSFDSGEEHQQSRFGPRRKVSKNTFTKQATINPTRLKAYINKIISRVGTAKAGWADCAKKLGGSRGIPQWVTRHAGKRASGIVTDNTNSRGNEQYILMENSVPWIDKCLNGGQLQRALDIQREKMNAAIEIALSRSSRA